MPLQSETITQCLQGDSTKWESVATQNSSREELKDSHLSTEKVHLYYEKETSHLPKTVSMEHMGDLSRQMGEFA